MHSEQLPNAVDHRRDHHFVSLWNMLQVHSIQFETLLDGVNDLEQALAVGSMSSPQTFGTILGGIMHDIGELELGSSLKQAERINSWLVAVNSSVEAQSTGVDLNPLVVLVRELKVRIQEDLEESVFFAIAPNDVRRCFQRTHANNYTEFEPQIPEKFFGAGALRSFPSTSFDINEACRCLFTDRSTACVFHLMRVLEIGLSAFAKRFGVPSDHTNWHNIIEGIEKAVRHMGDDPATRPSDWKEQQEYFSKAATHFMFLKEGWRNYTAHVRGKYTKEESETILANVKGLMQKLSERLSE